MEELRYPIGIQTFSKIIEQGYVYVDKTRFISSLLRQGQFIFLSRPRRFGKSLFVSTLKAFFQGRRDLFKNLDIDKENLDWTPSPVIHFDFNSEDFSNPEGLLYLLDSELRNYERIYGRDSEDLSPSQRFKSLIRKAFEESGRPVVILIDEYDKPLLGLEQNEDLFLKNQRILKSFFGNLKSMDEYIRFGFLTGVARFSKVSIFSDLNNLDDISMDEEYANICGLTEEELIASFAPGIQTLAKKRGEDFEATLMALRQYYDGYLFAEQGTRLYNPFSVLKALKKKSIDAYWFDSGTPTFLAESIISNKIDPMDINQRQCSRRALMQVKLGAKDPLPLMFQTGYLTIDSYDYQRQRYTLRFPNREVEKAFAEELLPLYVNETGKSDSEFSFFKFQDDLFEGEPQKFMNRLSTLFKDIPSEDQCESVYRAVTYLLCKLTSTDTRAEQHSYKGRSDIEVITPDYIYLFEFKYNRSIHEAMKQIHSRDYAGKYNLSHRKVFLIGANFDSSKEHRGLKFEIEELKNNII